MSDRDESKKPKRRRIQVEGESGEEQTWRSPKPRSVDEILRIVEAAQDIESAQAEFQWDEEQLKLFVAGQITLADLEGITKQEQYQIAAIGHSYLVGGNLEKAKVVYEGLLALEPFDAYFHLALASIAQQQDKFEEAVKGYTRALEINPYSPTAYANRGECHLMLGMIAEGTNDLIRAIEEDPEGREPATIRARATISALKEQLGSLDQDELKRKAAEEKEVIKAKEAARKAAAPRSKPAAPRVGPRRKGAPRARRPGPRKK